MINYSVDGIDFRDDFNTAKAFEKLELKIAEIEQKRLFSVYPLEEMEKIYSLLKDKAQFTIAYRSNEDTSLILEDYQCFLKKDDNGYWRIEGENYGVRWCSNDSTYILSFSGGKIIPVTILGIRDVDII